jgi:hypothetical protein
MLAGKDACSSTSLERRASGSAGERAWVWMLAGKDACPSTSLERRASGSAGGPDDCHILQLFRV